jgi:hypothetical protein
MLSISGEVRQGAAATEEETKGRQVIAWEIQRWADEELRSLNGQIEYVLRQALGKRAAKSGATEDEVTESGDEEG